MKNQQKYICQNFKPGISHWGNKTMKRCKSTAIKELNGVKMCINCYNSKTTNQ